MTDPAQLVERLECCYTGVVHDVMKAMGLHNFVLPHDIRPLIPGKRIAGPVMTVSGRVDPSADRHHTFLKWTEVLSHARSGHVIVCQPNDGTIAHMGELSGETLMHRGVRGYIVDGGCRDTEFLIAMGFQTFCRYLTPKDLAGYWLAESIDELITIGDVAIAPGDFVVADRDGVCILPRAHAMAIADAAEKAIGTENIVRKAILEGMDPREAYLTYGTF